jgi:hypothetical protein
MLLQFHSAHFPCHFASQHFWYIASCCHCCFYLLCMRRSKAIRGLRASTCVRFLLCNQQNVKKINTKMEGVNICVEYEVLWEIGGWKMFTLTHSNENVFVCLENWWMKKFVPKNENKNFVKELFFRCIYWEVSCRHECRKSFFLYIFPCVREFSTCWKILNECAQILKSIWVYVFTAKHWKCHNNRQVVGTKIVPHENKNILLNVRTESAVLYNSSRLSYFYSLIFVNFYKNRKIHSVSVFVRVRENFGK